MKWYFALYVIMSGLLLGTGCAQIGLTVADIIPIPFVRYDEDIVSVDKYKRERDYDCLTKKHDMQDEIDSANHAARMVNKFTSKIRIMGKSPNVKPEVSIYQTAKKVGENNYELRLKEFFKIEKQIDENSCWAACSQILIAHRFGKYLTQQELLQKVKPGQNQDINTSAADIMDIMGAVGFTGVKYSQSGATQLLKSLSQNQPVMIGLKPETPGQPGHAVVVVAAKFSFARNASPSCTACTKYAFSALVIMDPATGELHKVNASEYDDRIIFVLSYFDENA